MPTIARPFPLSRPLEREIFNNATVPRIMAGSAVNMQVKGQIIARTSAAVASPLVFGADDGTAPVRI
jgi:hypothetical protein